MRTLTFEEGCPVVASHGHRIIVRHLVTGQQIDDELMVEFDFQGDRLIRVVAGDPPELWGGSGPFAVKLPKHYQSALQACLKTDLRRIFAQARDIEAWFPKAIELMGPSPPEAPEGWKVTGL